MLSVSAVVSDGGSSVWLGRMIFQEDISVREVLQRAIDGNPNLKSAIAGPEMLSWGKYGCKASSKKEGRGIWEGSLEKDFLSSFPEFEELKNEGTAIKITIFLPDELRLQKGEGKEFKIHATSASPPSPRGTFCPSPSASSTLSRSRSPGPYCSRSLSRSNENVASSSFASCPASSFPDRSDRPAFGSHSRSFPNASTYSQQQSPPFVARSPSPPPFSASSAITNPTFSVVSASSSFCGSTPGSWRQADHNSSLEMIKLDQEPLLKKQSYHEFAPTQIILEPCVVCHKRIFRKALRCGACKILIHPDCQNNVEECNFNLKRTSLARPDMAQVRGIMRAQSSLTLSEPPTSSRRLTCPQTVRRKDISPQTSRRDKDRELPPVKKMWTLRDTRWNSRVTYPVTSRTTYSIKCGDYQDPLKSFHEYFSLPNPLQHLDKGDDGKDKQFTLEMQEILAFRSRIAQLFRDFDAKAIPEMTASFVPRTPSDEDKLKLVDLKCYAGTDVSRGMKVTLSLDTPIRKLVTKAINYGLLPSIKSVEDVVLRRVGRKEFIWQLDNPLVCYDFAIEASETRRLLQFSVCSKSAMKEEGIVFDEQDIFKQKCNEKLHQHLGNIWPAEQLSEEEMNQQFGMDVAKREEVFDVHEIKEPFEITFRGLANLVTNERKISKLKGWMSTADEQEIFCEREESRLDLPKIRFDRSWVYFVEVVLHSGDKALAPRLYTNPTRNGFWFQENGRVIAKDLFFANMPPETLLCLTVYAGKDDSFITIGCTTLGVSDHTGRYREGKMHLALWPNRRANPTDSLLSNPDPNALVLVVEFPTFPHPMVYLENSSIQNSEEKQPQEVYSKPVLKSLERLLARSDALTTMREDELEMIWKYRSTARELSPEELPKIVLSAPPNSYEEVSHLVSPVFSPILPTTALELLDSKFRHRGIRDFAVQCLAKASDTEMEVYVLQLIQALKYEPHHFSSLSFLLLFKALHCKKIGYKFFWMLVAEITSSSVTGDQSSLTSLRFLLYVDAYLTLCGEDISNSLLEQMKMMQNFSKITEGVKGKKERTVEARKKLSDVQLPKTFTLPTDSDRVLAGIDPNRCKVMQSNTAPLWLTFTSPEENASPYILLFKKGDDLRKDIMVLQMFNIFDLIWKNGNLDLRMNIYNVVMTGYQEGLVQVVCNSRTCADIQREEHGARGAFKTSLLSKWLAEKNPSDLKLKQAVNNFIHSCAGYCVATWVLGIGDRHNDNIMVSETGHFFHIDFAHILGAKLKFVGFERETAPFIFTREFLRVMGDDGFKLFQELCVKAYTLLRKKTSLIISLFCMMLGSNVPGVSKYEDLYYLRESLATDKNDEEAEKYFEDLITESLNCKRTQLNFWAHIVAN